MNRVRTSYALARGLALAILTTASLYPAPGIAGTSRTFEPADLVLAHSGRQGAEPAGELFGSEVASADFNADGRTDLAVAAPTDSAEGDTSYGRGAVYVYFGRGAGFPTSNDQAEAVADCVITGEAPFANLGTAVTSGDFDGDGWADLALSERDHARTFQGVVYLVSGRDIARSRALRMSVGEYISRIDGRTEGAEGGRWLWFGQETAAGDFNGDGIDDLAAGAWAGDGVSGDRPEAGEVAVFLGRPNWRRELVAAPGAADLFVVGARQGGWFGYGLTSGNVDGRGSDELVVSSRSDERDSERLNAGLLSVLDFGPGTPFELPTRIADEPLGFVWDLAATAPSGVVAGAGTADRIGSSAEQLGGRSLASGDLDGDGLDDLLVGAPTSGTYLDGSAQGAVYAVYGDTALTRGEVIDLASPGQGATLVARGEAGDSLGDAVRCFDLNEDGRADAIIGLPGRGGGRGGVLVFAGRAARESRTTPDAIIQGTVPGCGAGTDVLVLDRTFAGRTLLAATFPTAPGRVAGIPQPDAGRVCAVDATTLLASVPREPIIQLGAMPLAITPGATESVTVEVRGGEGALSLDLEGAPSWALLRERSPGGYTLEIHPGRDDRGTYRVGLRARDAADHAVARAFEFVVGFTPRIADVRLTGKRTYKLTVSGTDFSNGDAELLIDGVPMTSVRYPRAFATNGGATSTHLACTSRALVTALDRGEPAEIRIRNPREGTLSEPFTFVP